MSVAHYRNDLIKGKMAELGLTREDFVNVHPNTVSNIRNGKDVKISTLKLVLEQLDLNILEIFTPAPEKANSISNFQIDLGK